MALPVLFRRFRKIRVKDIISPRAYVLTEDMSIYAACERMIRENHRGYPVVDKGGKLVGFLTDRDIISRVLMKNIRPIEVRVRDIMTKNPKKISPNATIEEASELLLKDQINKTSVIDESDRVIGILNMKDILRVAPRYLKILRDEFVKPTEESVSIGKCENCGIYETLIYRENLFICENCEKIAKKNRLSS